MRILEGALELWFFLANIDDHGWLQSQNAEIKEALGSTVHNSYLDFNEAGFGLGGQNLRRFTPSFFELSELSEHSEASVWRIIPINIISRWSITMVIVWRFWMVDLIFCWLEIKRTSWVLNKDARTIPVPSSEDFFLMSRGVFWRWNIFLNENHTKCRLDL